MMPTDDSDALQIGPDPDKLYLYHRQQLSAMLDGELSPDQARFMLRRLQHDTELASCWERWQVCGDVLRGQRNALLPADFAQHVARAIADDGGVAEPVSATAGRTRLWRWGGGAALAASVAMAALFVAREPLQAPGDVSEAPTPMIAAVPPPTATDETQTPADAAGALESGLALAGAAAVAAAEVPRRNEERRSRGQSQRAATTREQRRAEQAPATVAVAARNPRQPAVDRRALPAPPAADVSTAVAATGSDAAIIDPFAVSPALPSRPWPRAIAPELSGRGGGFTVGYGDSGASASFHPFEPRMAAGQVGSSAAGLSLAPATAIGASATPVAEPGAEPADLR
ncbi:RseA family anti-sigma factor [Luteimonas suaedae]|uniref:RseA family anti-sigma factor n=1 Tax=Luteimonas suaedae TaxID=2605430 RepID=UPI0021050A45|nr:RseA family anti-sigma factor [Luteimonas suaedae]